MRFRFRLLSFRLLSYVAAILLLAAAVSAGEQVSELTYPIWAQEYSIESYYRSVATSQIILSVGGVLVLLLLSVVVLRVARKGQRFRFSLSWLLAFAFALSVALYGGVGWWMAEKPDDENLRFRKRVEGTLQRRLCLEYEEQEELASVARVVQSLDRGVSIVVSPELAGKKIRPSIQSVTVRDAINHICKLAGAGCDVRHGAMFIYPEGKRPPIRKRFRPREKWETETAVRLKRRFCGCFVDTPLTEVMQFVSSLSRVKISFDPDIQAESIMLNLELRGDIRMDDALTWSCFLSDTEWTVRKSDDGVGEVWISPRPVKQ